MRLITSKMLKEKAKKYFIDEDAVGHRDIVEGKEPLKKEPLSEEGKKALKHPNKLGAGAKKRKKIKDPQEKVHVVLKEHKKGTLHAGSGKLVPKGEAGKDQAIAIAMHEAGLNKVKELKKNWELIKAKIIDHNNNFQNVAKQPLKDPEISENDVDPKELEMGIQDEMEHTDDEDVAKKITLHHLQKDPKYYSKLKQGIVPNEGESEGEQNPEQENSSISPETPKETPAENNSTDTTSQDNKEETYHEDEDLNSIAKELIASGIPREQIDEILNPVQAGTATPTTTETKQPEKTIDEELDEIGKQVKLKELKLKSRQLDSELAGNGEQPAKQTNPKL
jgi:hypothetical protein